MNHTRRIFTDFSHWVGAAATYATLLTSWLFLLSENTWSDPSSTGLCCRIEWHQMPRIIGYCRDVVYRTKGNISRTQRQSSLGARQSMLNDSQTRIHCFYKQSTCQLWDHASEFQVQVISRTHTTLLVYLTLPFLRRVRNGKRSSSSTEASDTQLQLLLSLPSHHRGCILVIWFSRGWWECGSYLHRKATMSRVSQLKSPTRYVALDRVGDWLSSSRVKNNPDTGYSRLRNVRSWISNG